MNKHRIENEIKKLRRVVNNPKLFTEQERDSAWAAMLTLQWTRTRKIVPGLTPTTFVVPRLGMKSKLAKAEQKLFRTLK